MRITLPHRLSITPDDNNKKSYCNINNHSKPKDVYKLIEKLNVLKTTLWRGNLKFPSTNEMLKDVADYSNSCLQNTQKHQTKLHKLKMELDFNSNRGENNETKMVYCTKIVLNKRDDDNNISSEETVLRNLYDAINHLEK